MAHGAPDHTRLSDDAFSHYLLRYHRRIIWPHGVVVTDMYNIDSVGVFGYLAMCINSPNVEVKIWCDGFHIGTFNIKEFRDSFGYGDDHGNPYVSVPFYDAINNRYTMIIDYRWNIYFHKNLTITTVSTDLLPHTSHDIRLLYKTLV